MGAYLTAGPNLIPLMSNPPSKYGDEQVLVVPALDVKNFLDEEVGREHVGFFDFADAILPGLIENKSFRLRDEAEYNPEYKQLINYALVTSQGKVLSYSRVKNGSTEERLAGKRSLGVGGHVNPEDWNDDKNFVEDIFTDALKRELMEELGVREDYIDHVDLLGLVNSSNAVGLVHLGLVWRVELYQPKIYQLEKHLADPQWHEEDDLMSHPPKNLELWSELILNTYYS